MLIEYTPKNFRPETRALIDQCNEIIEEYAADDLDLTLRQLFYQLVARGLLGNTVKNYDRLSEVVSDARLAGLLSWAAIVDRLRVPEVVSHWERPGDVLEAAAAAFRLEKWRTQPHWVEVWVEKDALSGVLEPVCRALDVPFFACRGYVSQSAMWRAAQRFEERRSRYGQEVTILHLGDHDPSGLDMTRDIGDRHTVFGVPVDVRRLALNHDQIKKFNPPPNPVKMLDSRAPGYRARFGQTSWELDALDPRTLRDLVTRHVLALRDKEAWAAAEREEARLRAALAALARENADL